MRKIVILNLSDLHIQKNNFQQQATLVALKSELEEFLKNNIEWTPLFIVLPGDIVNNDGDYEEAKSVLEQLKEACSINENFRIIMNPGNHDKGMHGKERKKLSEAAPSQEVEKYKEMLANFDAFCNDPRKNIDAFCSFHEKGFKEFNCFYKEYCEPGESDTDFRYIPYPHFKDKLLCYTTGVKVFDKEKICFLSLNTEWLYASNEIMKKTNVEEYKAGRNIVSYLTRELSSFLPDYTVITLMHRNPNTLHWDERYDSEPYQKEYTLGNIMKCSDVIISGHEHGVTTSSPDLLLNAVQHIRLGTPSCLPTGGTNSGNTFPYSISLMKINMVKEELTLVKVPYRTIPIEGIKEWDFESGLKWAENYTLRNKYDKPIQGKSIPLKTVASQFIKVRNYDREEIEARIKKNWSNNDNEYQEAVELIIEDIDEFKIEGFDAENFTKQKIIHLVLYKRFNYNMDFEINNGQKLYEKIMEAMENEILLGKFVISYVIVKMPYDYSNHINNHLHIQ